jgi:hypothetical protein
VGRSTHNNTIILGYVEGFIRPGVGYHDVHVHDHNTTSQQRDRSLLLLHLDKMIVFQNNVQHARDANIHFRGGGRHGLGIGLWLGYRCLLHGYDHAMSHAEFLAINDSPEQHQTLVRYYSNAGFTPVRYVGDGPWYLDLRDQIIWGGAGTLFRRRIDNLLLQWTNILQKSLKKEQNVIIELNK